MLRLDVNAVSESLALGVQRQASRAEGEVPSEQEVRDGLRVTLSELGRVRATAKNDDIDEADLPDNIKDQMDDKLTVRMEAIISSMTPKERAHPDLIKGSRKRRIAAGSGMQVQDVNKLLKQFTEMQRMMKKMSGKGGMRKMMGQMKNMLPPGFGGGGRGPF